MNEWNEIFVIQERDFSPVDFFLFLAERECRVQLLSKIASIYKKKKREKATVNHLSHQSPLIFLSTNFHEAWNHPSFLVVRFIFVLNSSRETSGKSCRFSTNGNEDERHEQRKSKREKKSREKVGGGIREKEKGRISRVKRRNKWRWTKGVEGIEFTARKVGHFTSACTSSLCFVPTVMFTCRERCCIRTLVQTHTHTYVHCANTRGKDVERLLEDSPFSRKNVNFSTGRGEGRGGRGKSETGRKRMDRNG